MTWEERIRLYGAPGPRVGDRFSGSQRPRERAIARSRGGRILNPPPAGPIIVGIEGSERSADALALADQFAGLLKGPLVLVHNHPREEARKLRGPRGDEHQTRSLYESTFTHVPAASASNCSAGRRYLWRSRLAVSPTRRLR
jgi:hypothetical protein